MCAEAISCPKCGATIHFPIGQDQTTCQYCGSSISKPIARMSNLERIQEAEICVERAKKCWYVDWQRGLALLKRAIELDPENIQAWTWKGSFLIGSVGGEKKIAKPENSQLAEEALRCLQKACELGFDSMATNLRKSLALKLDKWDEIRKGTYKSGY